MALRKIDLKSILSNILADPPSAYYRLGRALINRYPKAVLRCPLSWLLRPASTFDKAQKLYFLGEISEAYRLLTRLSDSNSQLIHFALRRNAETILALRLADLINKSSSVRMTSVNPGKKRLKQRGKPEIRLLMYVSGYPPKSQNGYAIRTKSICEELASLGVDVTVVVASRDRGNHSLTTTEFNSHFRLIRLPYSSATSAESSISHELQYLTKLVLKFDCNILHTTSNFEIGVFGAHAAKLCLIPWVYELRGELHQTWLSKKGHQRELAQASEYFSKASKAEQILANQSDLFVALSQLSVNRILFNDSPHALVVPNGYSPSDLVQHREGLPLKERLQLEGFKLFGSVSSIVDYEGFETAIRALSILPDDWKLVLVGDGESLPRLKQLASDLNLEDRIHFAGRQPQSSIAEWYSLLDVFIIPRKNYDVCKYVTPIKGTMAQALGVPIVASDLPAIREVTQHAETYVTPDDPYVLAEAIVKRVKRGSTGVDLQPRDWGSLVSPLVSKYEEIIGCSSS